jgi:hypothetical protein
MALYTDNAQAESEISSSALLKIIYGYKKLSAFFVVAKLRIADLLSNDPITVHKFAKSSSVNSRSSYHLMRLLEKSGIFMREIIISFRYILGENSC